MKRSEDGVKHYGPFYLEIPLMEKTDNNNKNVSLKDPGGQEPVKEEQKVFKIKSLFFVFILRKIALLFFFVEEGTREITHMSRMS